MGLIWRVSESSRAIWVGVDWQEKAVNIPRDWILETTPLIERLRGHKVSRQALREGGFTMKSYENAINEGWEPDLQAAKALAGDPRWEVLVEIA